MQSNKETCINEKSAQESNSVWYWRCFMPEVRTQKAGEYSRKDSST